MQFTIRFSSSSENNRGWSGRIKATRSLLMGLLILAASLYGIYRMMRYGNAGGEGTQNVNDFWGVIGFFGFMFGLFFTSVGLLGWGIDPIPNNLRPLPVWAGILLTVFVAAFTAYCGYRGLRPPHGPPWSWWEIGAVSGALVTSCALRGWWAWWQEKRWAIDLSPNRCRRCGYDLTGNRSGRCPECGAEISARERSVPLS